MKKLRKIIFRLVLVTLFLFFLFAGEFLNYSTKLVKSDVIIVLGGGKGERELEASKLYKEKYANYVMLSDGGTRLDASTDKANLEIDWLNEDGVPKSNIITELKSRSTFTNALYTKRLMNKRDFTSAIVVSSSYHMRRSEYTFKKVYNNSGFKLYFHAAPVPGYDPLFWWKNKLGWKYTTKEYAKFIAYLANYEIRHRMIKYF